MSEADKLIFARFANATWKAGQPFRDLKRITRATFTPFYFLTEADIERHGAGKGGSSKIVKLFVITLPTKYHENFFPPPVI